MLFTFISLIFALVLTRSGLIYKTSVKICLSLAAVADITWMVFILQGESFAPGMWQVQISAHILAWIIFLFIWSKAERHIFRKNKEPQQQTIKRSGTEHR